MGKRIMSGKYKKQSGFVYLHEGRIDEYNEAMIISIFDEQTDYDIEDIEKDMKEEKLFKKICLIKTIMFPLEILLTFLILGRSEFIEKIETQKLYIKLLRNKLNVSEFKEEVMDIALKNKP
jgi:hypothetical protein